MKPDKLQPYRKKRDFSRTSEPIGGSAGIGGNRFVVHKHHATSHHYDLRLQLGDVLKSWAVPKGPSLDPEEKRLAVETEDHPLEYVDFEGVIPEAEYGGGPMIVWDEGVWAPMGDPEEDLARGAFKFRLAGQKLSGGWMLTRLKPKPGETKRNWLLFKERDEAADSKLDILAARPESVKTGRRIEELLPPPAPAKAVRLRPGALAGAVRAPLPDRIEPQLASSVSAPPDGNDWLHEIKYDGYRTMARVDRREVRLITRGGLDWTKRYGDLPAAFAALPCRDAIIDGEIVVLDEKGVSRFGLLAVADTIKDNSRAAIAALHEMGIHVVMVTGDNERTARHVASQVGIDEVMAGVLPEGKVDAVRALQEKHGAVAMVGDGINDAPALKQANVGIAIGAGADVAIEAADVTLVSGELTKAVEAIRLSRATFSKIVQNLFWAWFYNLAAIPIAALGLLHPMIGVVAMTASSLSVIGNSLLLRRRRLEVAK